MEIARVGQNRPGEPSQHQLFDGDAFLAPLAGQDLLRVNEVRFAPGARTKWHVHTYEQVLIVTEGQGIVASEKAEQHVTPGDVIVIPAGERHWHGSNGDGWFAHVSVNSKGETQW